MEPKIFNLGEGIIWSIFSDKESSFCTGWQPPAPALWPHTLSVPAKQNKLESASSRLTSHPGTKSELKVLQGMKNSILFFKPSLMRFLFNYFWQCLYVLRRLPDEFSGYKGRRTGATKDTQRCTRFSRGLEEDWIQEYQFINFWCNTNNFI